MAEKRITTVDEILTIDPDADYLLVSRGLQQDLRRIRLRLLPAGWDIHDDLADELTTLAGVDRLAISDEGSPGAPQKFVKLSTLRSFLMDLFDLHDDVPTELDAAAPDDRLLISDESEVGDPQKFITVRNLLLGVNALNYEELSTEHNYGTNGLNVTESHTLGRPPVAAFPIAICKVSDYGYSVGDKVYISSWAVVANNSNAPTQAIGIVSSSNTQVRISYRSGEGTNRGLYIPHKTQAASWSRRNSSSWKVKFLVWG